MENSEDRQSVELLRAGVEVFKTAYDDALQPVSKELGKALGTLGRTINVALSPFRGLIWSWDRIEEYLTRTVEQKLSERNVPATRVISPDVDIAVPAIEAIRYSKLRENYANLLAAAMDRDTSSEVHPAFVEILKQLSADEILILESLPALGCYEPIVDMGYLLDEPGQELLLTHRHVCSLGIDFGCNHQQVVPPLIDNLCRLGLTEIPPSRQFRDTSRYNRIFATDFYRQYVESVQHERTHVHAELRMIGLTPLGDAFKKACVQ